MGVFELVTVVSVLILLYAEWRKNGLLRWISKPIAAVSFVLAARANGALDSEYGRAVFAALVLSMIGDVLLIPKSKSIFKAGVLVFLLAHVAYVFAFFAKPLSYVHAAVAAAVLAVVGVTIARKILPGVSRELKIPVVAYMLVISTMVAFSIATQNAVIITAAVMFYASDLCVARERFVSPGLINKLIGLPLYFGAQLVFVATLTR